MTLYPKYIDSFSSFSLTGAWSKDRGTAEASTTRFISPPSSLKIGNWTWLRWNFGTAGFSFPTDEWAYEFYIYIEASTYTLDAGVQASLADDIISQIVFDHADEKIRYHTDASTSYDVCDFNHEEWIHIRVEGSNSSETQDIYVNGVLEADGVDVRVYPTGGLDTVVSFFTNAGNPDVYFDNFKFYSDESGNETVSGVIQSGGSYAAIDVAAYRRSDGLLVDETTSSAVDGTYTLNLIGDDTEEHYIIAEKADDNMKIIDRVVAD